MGPILTLASKVATRIRKELVGYARLGLTCKQSHRKVEHMHAVDALDDVYTLLSIAYSLRVVDSYCIDCVRPRYNYRPRY